VRGNDECRGSAYFAYFLKHHHKTYCVERGAAVRFWYHGTDNAHFSQAFDIIKGKTAGLFELIDLVGEHLLCEFSQFTLKHYTLLTEFHATPLYKDR
jgi:hypothetical protein